MLTMGQYGTHQVITREFRASSEDADALVADMARDHVIGAGYTPVGKPVLTWYEVTEDEAERDAIVNGFATVRAGDWRVRGMTEVAEDKERFPSPPLRSRP